MVGYSLSNEKSVYSVGGPSGSRTRVHESIRNSFLRDLPCYLYSFGTLAGRLPLEVLVVSRSHYHEHLMGPCSISSSCPLVRTEPPEDGWQTKPPSGRRYRHLYLFRFFKAVRNFCRHATISSLSVSKPCMAHMHLHIQPTSFVVNPIPYICPR